MTCKEDARVSDAAIPMQLVTANPTWRPDIWQAALTLTEREGGTFTLQRFILALFIVCNQVSTLHAVRCMLSWLGY